MNISDPAARLVALARASKETGRRNEDLLRDCEAVFAVLDGPDVDSGTAQRSDGPPRWTPSIAWKSDFRRASDNEAALVNLQVQYFIERSGGGIETDLRTAIRRLNDSSRIRARRYR